MSACIQIIKAYHAHLQASYRTHATEPLGMAGLKAFSPRCVGEKHEAVHYAALIHAKGCVQQDMVGARALFDTVF